MTNLSKNLRILCSYGRSIADVCRKLSVNRQQFERYLTGQTQPSLSTLRRISDFFGVDEAEILMDPRAFEELIKLRPPRLGSRPSRFEIQTTLFWDRRSETDLLLERHAGFYHVYICPEPDRQDFLRSLTWIGWKDGIWMSKTLVRFTAGKFALPSCIRYNGIVFEGHNRIMVQEREFGGGRSVWSTILQTSDRAPQFLTGLTMGISPKSSHLVYSTRTVWQYLGKSINAKAALQACGVLDLDAAELPTYVKEIFSSVRGQSMLELIV